MVFLLITKYNTRTPVFQQKHKRAAKNAKLIATIYTYTRQPGLTRNPHIGDIVLNGGSRVKPGMTIDV
jgi:hypothetical protein